MIISPTYLLVCLFKFMYSLRDTILTTKALNATFECDREMFDEFLSLHGNTQPNFTMMRRKEVKKERILTLN